MAVKYAIFNLNAWITKISPVEIAMSSRMKIYDLGRYMPSKPAFKIAAITKFLINIILFQ
jgi:hypothetical protein